MFEVYRCTGLSEGNVKADFFSPLTGSKQKGERGMKKDFIKSGSVRAVFRRNALRPVSLIFILCFFVVLLHSADAVSQQYVEFPEIWSSNVDDYEEFQAKITFMGPQTKSVKTLAFSAESYPLDMGLFIPFQYTDADYSNDSNIITIQLTAAEFKKFADQIMSHPELLPLGYIPDAVGAVAIVRGYPPNEIAWEHMCLEPELRTVFSILYSSIDPAETSDLEKVLARKRNFVGP